MTAATTTKATTAPPMLALSQGPAWLFCTATLNTGSLCQAGLRPDSTCPEAAYGHRRAPWREYAPRRMDAPPVIYREPLCSLCEEPTYFDGDGFACDNCDFSWSTSSTEPGEPRSYGERQCDATTEDEHARYRCLLTEGHEGYGRRKLRITTREFRFVGGRYQFVDHEREPEHIGVRVEANGYPDPFGCSLDESGHRWSA